MFRIIKPDFLSFSSAAVNFSFVELNICPFIVKVVFLELYYVRVRLDRVDRVSNRFNPLEIKRD